METYNECTGCKKGKCPLSKTTNQITFKKKHQLFHPQTVSFRDKFGSRLKELQAHMSCQNCNRVALLLQYFHCTGAIFVSGLP